MSDIITKCMCAPLVLERDEVQMLMLLMLASIAEAVGLDDEEIF